MMPGRRAVACSASWSRRPTSGTGSWMLTSVMGVSGAAPDAGTGRIVLMIGASPLGQDVGKTAVASTLGGTAGAGRTARYRSAGHRPRPSRPVRRRRAAVARAAVAQAGACRGLGDAAGVSSSTPFAASASRRSGGGIESVTR